MWVVLTTVTVLYVLRYAAAGEVRPRPLDGRLPARRRGRAQRSGAAAADPPAVLVLVWVAFTFVVMIFGIIPWSQIIDGPDAAPYPWELGWGFGQLAAWFLVAAIVVGLIGGLGEKKLSATISAGAGDFISAGLVIVLARGVAAIMNNAQITDTVLHAMEGAVDSLAPVGSP